MQPFPNIEEYDALILNLVSLDQNLFDTMIKTKAGQLRQLRETVVTFMANGRNIYCLISPLLKPTRPPSTGPAWTTIPSTNYDWMPAIPSLQPREGKSIEAIVELEFIPYFKHVETWNLEISGFQNPSSSLAEGLVNAYAELLMESIGGARENQLKLSMQELALNKISKDDSMQSDVSQARNRWNISPSTYKQHR